MDPVKYPYLPHGQSPYVSPPAQSPESQQSQSPPPYQSVQPPYNPASSPPLVTSKPQAPKPPAPKPPLATDYKITVRGRVKKFAKQFAIDIVSGGHILLHMNVRFGYFGDITVFNSYTNSEWGPEERRNFITLKRGTFFSITIESRGGFYFIDVNNGEKYTYVKRFPEGPTRELKISKVEDNDVSITGFEIAPF
ncbi:PREDICTED: galectin-4-like [Rhagoletis zephyria]|uniref:galectin-4-like n=1 Tax=Rhagoletis zephyria TaxID=28612 RepID=UPI00081138C8|nr:PREDICTED: galectin-4-like [Rhagoletis zephyria]